ncbi:hypothetical protein EVAR_92797_1 [Eumeta japonica]|uniref:Uncharacterized protein n=1 Tax=Eumeta variegata TaxID=151549 RepID=A0A4C1ZZI6_EUMVA|nr:hypothetical protein EVAR_92797_1 [Eumeta japonica]
MLGQDGDDKLMIVGASVCGSIGASTDAAVCGDTRHQTAGHTHRRIRRYEVGPMRTVAVSRAKTGGRPRPPVRVKANSFIWCRPGPGFDPDAGPGHRLRVHGTDYAAD